MLERKNKSLKQIVLYNLYLYVLYFFNKSYLRFYRVHICNFIKNFQLLVSFRLIKDPLQCNFSPDSKSFWSLAAISEILEAENKKQ